MKINWPLFAVAVGAFGIGTTEFAPMGLLPVIATGLHVSIPAAGLLVTGYALGVMVGAPLLTLPTGRLDRKLLLVGLMGLFTLGNLLAAVAPGYGWLMAARIVTSLCHGSFFGVGSVVAASLVAPERRAGAVAAMFSGLTIANIGGVPLAAWIGQHIGWRAAFAGIGGLGVIAMIALVLALPRIAGNARTDIRRELKAMGRPAVLLALLATVLGSAAMFTVFTYIAPILQHVTHVSENMVTATLVIYGIGLTVGNALGGRFADKALTPTLIVVFSSLVTLLVLFAWTMHSAVPAIATVFAWGVATFALVPSLQARVMSVASDAPNLASSINIGAFNLGNAIGAALGGGVIAAGLSYTWVSVAGAAMAAGGLALILLTRAQDDQRSRSAT
ncbi:MFS transporter [Sphingomonas bacterium]|uniref:MFS transporter n=1 Tax=Sphingomonas bacterium TaxID=1895847 RepID=UPI001576A345|nr:MFS transporter [Sphingomonas bacterium]